MALFLFRFFPVLLPLLVYAVWHFLAKRKAKKEGKPIPRFRDLPIYWLVMSSLLVGILCMLFLAFSVGGDKGNYIPPHLEGGQVVPAHIKP